jgi:DNA polymerase-3 subunit delta
MPPTKKAAKASALLFVFGGDDFAVVQRGKEIYRRWEEELGGMDHETIDARVGNSGEALTALGRLREALNTLPFFGGGKAIWFKDCSFLGDDRTSTSSAVTEALAELSELLKGFEWGDVRLVITAGKVDKRKSFYKTLKKIGGLEEFAGWSASDRDWADRAEMLVRELFEKESQAISAEAISKLVQCVGPNPRQLQSEVEKLCLFAADQESIEVEDIDAIAVRNKQAQAFAFAEALGDRSLTSALRILDEELWTMQFEKGKSEIGLLYGLITKVRVLLMAQELLRSGKLAVEGSYPRFKSRIERLNPEDYPQDRRYSPLGVNPYVLFKAMPQAKNYSARELVDAMETLLETNRRLVSSAQEARMVLQQALVRILGKSPAARR